MDNPSSIFSPLLALIPSVVITTLVVAAIILLRKLLNRLYTKTEGKRYRYQLIMLAVYVVALILVVISLPLGETLRGQLLSLIGIVVSATLALSSTTFIGNAMAGVMLRTLRNFHVGDFLRVGDHFGRISETGLLHVEIQTEDRDLMTIPNLYLVTNPTKVILASGTILSAQVSLGYEYAWQTIEQLLLEAARDTGLQDPFVLVINLGDFAVTYQISGLLTEVKQLISARSRLRKAMLERLHGGGIEIVSPTFMNTRAYRPKDTFIPEAPEEEIETAAAETAKLSEPEAIVFDIAEEAESLEHLREKAGSYASQVSKLKHQLDGLEGEERQKVEGKIKHLEEIHLLLTQLIQRREEE